MNTFSLSKISRSWLPVVLKSTMVFPLAAQTSDWYVFILFISIVCIVLINMLCTSIPLPGRIYYTSIWCILWCSFTDFLFRYKILRSLPTRGELLRRHQDASLNRLVQAASKTPLLSRCAVNHVSKSGGVKNESNYITSYKKCLQNILFIIYLFMFGKTSPIRFLPLEISLLEIKCWIPGSKALHTNIYRLFWPGDEMENGLSYKTILYII